MLKPARIGSVAPRSSCVVQSGIELPYQAVRPRSRTRSSSCYTLAATQAVVWSGNSFESGGYDVDRDRYERDELFSSGEFRSHSIGGHS
jgi:hypothetical protein